jgi:hypothetical protein
MEGAKTFLSGFKKGKPLKERGYQPPTRSFKPDLPYDVLLLILAHLPENYILKLCLLVRLSLSFALECNKADSINLGVTNRLQPVGACAVHLG